MTDMASGESYPCLGCGHLLGSEACDHLCNGQPQPTWGNRMDLPRTVSSGADVTVSVSSPLKHRCPFVDEVDDGSVDISWRCVGQTLELHSLAEWLRQWEASELSHEATTNSIKHALSAFGGIKDVTVTTRWATAGMSVTVTGGSGALLREPKLIEGA